MLSLEEKLSLWVKITGINPSEEKKSYTIYFDGRLSDYDVKRMNDRIIESLKYDETGIFAEAYLSIYLKKFIAEKSISLFNIIENEETFAFIEDVKTLNDAIKEVNAEQMIIDEAKKAMDFYKLPCNLDALSVMELRSSAIKCMNGKLNLMQFASGDSKGDKFGLSKDIVMFESLDALIVCAAKGNLNGITLGYIRDGEDLTDSYFAFIIKTGENLYLLTDMPKYDHPAQKSMKRCPGRDMSNRINSNWFPYDTVANIDVSDLWDSGRYGVRETKKELSAKVNEDTPYAVIGTIESLDESEAFWFIVMADLIKKKFYDNECPKLPLSYTRSMINSILLEKTENALIVQKALPSMELKEVAIEDTYGLTYQTDYSSDRDSYRYLVPRYDDKVDVSLLNIISNTDKALYIEDKYAKRDYWGKKTGCEYLSLELDNTAATEEDITYRQKWIARYNYAQQIKNAVKKDYEDKKDGLYETIGNYITPRIEELIKMHLRGELVGYGTERKGFDSRYTDKVIGISNIYEFEKWYKGDDGRGRYRYGFTGYNKTDLKCAFTGKSAGVVLSVKPRTAEELALCCGISKDELPEELRHYDKNENMRYYGNSILNNIDPFLWVISDTFNEMRFDITILMSKAKYLEILKSLGMEPVKFWENEKPVCHTSSKEEGCRGKYVNKWEGYHRECHLAKKCEKCKWYSGTKDR